MTSAIGERTPPGRTRGFTLVELLVVLAILVMMTALVPVAMNRVLPGRRVVVTADRLLSAVRDAQAQSLVSGRTVRLELHEDGALTRDSNLAMRVPTSIQVRLTDVEGRPLRALLAQPDGSMDAVRFEISAGAHRRTIAISEMTGRITAEAVADAR